MEEHKKKISFFDKTISYTNFKVKNGEVSH